MSKVFITGVFGSGKTTFAKKYSSETGLSFINFDEMFKYEQAKDKTYIKDIYNNFPEHFIIDAIPFSQNWELFIEYIQKYEDVCVIFTICSNPIEWLNRIMRFKQAYMKVKPETVADLTKSYFEQYANMYYKNLKSIEEMVDFKIFDTSTNEYISRTELYIRIDWAKEVYKEVK